MQLFPFSSLLEVSIPKEKSTGEGGKKGKEEEEEEEEGTGCLEMGDDLWDRRLYRRELTHSLFQTYILQRLPQKAWKSL